jgi:hypothetical protein
LLCGVSFHAPTTRLCPKDLEDRLTARTRHIGRAVLSFNVINKVHAPSIELHGQGQGLQATHTPSAHTLGFACLSWTENAYDPDRSGLGSIIAASQCPVVGIRVSPLSLFPLPDQGLALTAHSPTVQTRVIDRKPEYNSTLRLSTRTQAEGLEPPTARRGR